MTDTYDRLTAWRQAERLRDSIPRESAVWLDAEQEVRHARLVYQATIAQIAARYAEAGENPPAAWWLTPGSVSRSWAR